MSLLKSTSSTLGALFPSSSAPSTSASAMSVEDKRKARDFALSDLCVKSFERGVAKASIKHSKTITTMVRRTKLSAIFIEFNF